MKEISMNIERLVSDVLACGERMTFCNCSGEVRLIDNDFLDAWVTSAEGNEKLYVGIAQPEIPEGEPPAEYLTWYFENFDIETGETIDEYVNNRIPSADIYIIMAD